MSNENVVFIVLDHFVIEIGICVYLKEKTDHDSGFLRIAWEKNIYEIPALLSLSIISCLYFQVVNFLLRGWIQSLESDGSLMLPLLDGESSNHGVCKDLEFMREGSRRSVRVQFYGSKFSVWNWLKSQVKALFI